MIHIAKIADRDRQALFKNTAHKMGMTEAIIEKDFWVCWILDYLFHRSEWKDNIAFKGGTSLSKSYGLIERFSEDVDLILDWCVLGYGKDEPWEKRSKTHQDIFNKEANSRTEAFLKDIFVPLVNRDIQAQLPSAPRCHIDPNDPLTVLFAYVHNFDDISILPVIRLEFGALAAWTPAENRTITPYSAMQYPLLFKQPTTDILTVLPDRTFWEKVTILYREANRPQSKSFPTRYSRHYYDLYCMSHSPVKTTAYNNIKLLEKVVEFKDKFYHCPWAKYGDAKIGTLKLLPPEQNVAALKEDYVHMQNMIFGKKPGFDEIISCIETLETEINRLK